MIKFITIADKEFDNLLNNYEECILFLKEKGINLINYSYYFRMALNCIIESDFDYLLKRIDKNRDFENNDQGYEVSYFNNENKNPKTALINIIEYLKTNNPKYKYVKKEIEILNKFKIVGEANHIQLFHNKPFLTYKQVKQKLKEETNKKMPFCLYSFNSKKDFDFLYPLKNEIIIILFEIEKKMFDFQLLQYNKDLEKELTSEDRKNLCSIKYMPIIDEIIKVPESLSEILKRLDEKSNKDYEIYQTENDIILEELDEDKISYHLIFNDNSDEKIESNKTVFDNQNNLLKVYKLKEGDNIRIYPDREFANDLYKVATETEPDKFGKIEEHSKIWKNILMELEIQINRENLFKKLKEKGLKIISDTFDNYFRDVNKFPMYNKDIKIILNESNNENLIIKELEILKYKRFYNSTMISLGRGLKQEILFFLKNKNLNECEILKKINFKVETLNTFIKEKMPLKKIKSIEIINYEQ